MLYQLTSSGFRCFCPFYRGGCEQSPPQGSCFFSSLGADARRPPSFFTRRYRMPCAAKKRRAAWRVSFFVITHRFCCLHSRTSQGRGSVRGEPLTGSPTRVQSPARRRSLLRSKSAAPKKKRHTNVCLFFFGAGDEARTRYLDLGKVALYQMSYARRRHHYCSAYGASGRGRTGDTRIFSPLLYQLSYRGIWRPRRGSNPRPPA